MKTMEICTFSEADRRALVDLWRRCELTVPWNNPDQDIDRKVAFSPDSFWVGKVEGELVASVMFGYDGHRGSVNYLAVDPAFQGRGFGRLLMARVEETVRGWGCPKINLSVRASNTRVMAFYERLGYQVETVTNLGKRFEQDRPC